MQNQGLSSVAAFHDKLYNYVGFAATCQKYFLLRIF